MEKFRDRRSLSQVRSQRKEKGKGIPSLQRMDKFRDRSYLGQGQNQRKEKGIPPLQKMEKSLDTRPLEQGQNQRKENGPPSFLNKMRNGVSGRVGMALAALVLIGGCGKSDSAKAGSSPAVASRAFALEGDSPAASPNWDPDRCQQLFADQGFQSIWAAKAYQRADGSTYSLISGKKAGAYDIYSSELGANWSNPVLNNSVSTADPDLDIAIVEDKAYTTTAVSWEIRSCDWDNATKTASNCDLQAASDAAASLNEHDGYMYYSGGVGTAARKFDMSANPWTTSVVGLGVGTTEGVYVSEDTSLVAIACSDEFGPPLDCEPNESRLFRYNMPGWTNPTRLPFDQDSALASPFVAPDGSLWFVATPSVSPVQRRLYSCAPDQNDGYCGGSADSEGDCCVENCVGTGCGTHPACQPCEPVVTECTVDQACGAIDDGCGNPIDCGRCDLVADACSADGRNVVSTTVVCESNTCVSVEDSTQCRYGCIGGECQECVPEAECAPEAECGTMDDGCGNPIDCGRCDPVADACSSDGTRVISTNVSCESNECEYEPIETPCEDGCLDGTCVDDPCTNEHPNIQVGEGCEITYCGINAAVDPAVIRNVAGGICDFTVDVKRDGTPAAEITLRGNETCNQGSLEFTTEGGVVLGCGNEHVNDNGQHITTIPSGEAGVMTGIIGTRYDARRFITGAMNGFEVEVEEGCSWYEGNDFERIYIAPSVAACNGNTDEVFGALTLTTKDGATTVVTEDPHVIENPDAGVDAGGGDVDGGDDTDAGVDAGGDDAGGGDDADAGVDAGGGDAGGDDFDGGVADSGKSPDTKDFEPDEGKEEVIESDVVDRQGGSCSTSPDSSSNKNGIGLLIAGISLALSRVMRKKKTT